MKSLKVDLALILLSFFFTTVASQPKAGEQLPGWKEGYLDIHHISTGKGESSFYIMPDGTTMLVDAGATTRSGPRVTAQVPDSSRTVGEWITRYIHHMMEGLKSKKLDYILLTHFHDDHMGGLKANSGSSSSGAYKLAGITEVAESIPFGKIVDRGYPEYNFPKPLNDANMKNYLAFLKWQTKNRGVKTEQFRPGRNDQFVLLSNPSKYPGFEIRNIAANGHVWTGTGFNERNQFPAIENLKPEQYPDENKCSIAFRISYGKFDYFNGGDITGGPFGQWQDIETPAGLASGPVDVCEVNHHAYYDAMGLPFVQAVRPRVFILQYWSPGHPAVNSLANMQSQAAYPGPRDIFSTNMMEATKIVIGAAIDSFKSQHGHIVIRVAPGGDSYMIYVLDDSNEKYLIKSVHGPYESN
jgi:beta-lactamase superfamily II metal-dependent hydrolase